MASVPSRERKWRRPPPPLPMWKKTRFPSAPPLGLPERQSSASTLFIDAATRANLELVKTLSGQREGLAAQRHGPHRHRRRRAASGRAADVAADRSQEIAARQDAVAWLLSDNFLRAVAQPAEGRARHAAALSRLALDRGGPRDLAAIRQGLITAGEVAGADARDGSAG